MAVFSLLAKPADYQSDTWDLTEDSEGLEYWLANSVKTFESALTAAKESLVTNPERLGQAIEKSRQMLWDRLDLVRSDPKRYAPVTIHSLDKLCRQVLTKNGLQDPFLKIKHQENVGACAHYRRLVVGHDKLHDESLIRVLTEGMLAGNVFDLGATEIIHRYDKEKLDFFHTLDQLKPHPWLVDHYDLWRNFIFKPAQALKRVMFFVDNAGADFVLGCLPLARFLAKRGAMVILAANDLPYFNDMTAAECRAVIKALAQDDETLRFLLNTKRLQVVGSGGKYCQLNFKRISERCNRAAEGTSLLIIEGMGRAIESNYLTRFKCPTLKIAMLKDKWEAKKLGGVLYDLICKFEIPT
jgi:damage-control phosphatase, subfamily II, stand-alone protein